MFRLNTSSKEFARVIEWVPAWSTGAPMPQVFSNGHKTYLIYLIDEVDENFDGSYTNLIDNTSEEIYSLALVEFAGSTFKFGIANDEVFNGLPLYSKGLNYYSAHIVENSKWIAEIKEINSVHPLYNERNWDDLKHYMLLFHDEIFEILARMYSIQTYKTTFKNLAETVVLKMNS